MTALDEIDFEILHLLVEDARRPYSDIATHVDRSPPTVADRIDRMVEMGVIQGFSVDLDRTMLESGVAVLVDARTRPGRAAAVGAAIERRSESEHVFTTADGRVVFRAIVPPAEIESLLTDAVEEDAIVEYDVRLLTSTRWAPQLEGAGFALACAECGNTVTAEGESVRLDGQRYHFCCGSCLENFRERYERLQSEAGPSDAA